MRGKFSPDEAEDAGGLTPGKDDNEVWQQSARKDRLVFILLSDKTLQKDLRGRFVPDEADDADGLTPFKEDNEVWRKSGRKDIEWFYQIIVLYKIRTHEVRRDLYVQYRIHASHAGLHAAAKTPQSIKRFSIVLWKDNGMNP